MRPIGAHLATLAREDGANVVETAISCSVLFAILFGICQMSLALYAYQFTANAARQATRWAMVRGSTSCTNTPSLTSCNATSSNITSYVQGLGFPGITSSNLNVTSSWCKASSAPPTTWTSCSSSPGGFNAPGGLVKVVVSYPLSFHIPFSSSQSFSVSSTSQMVISQ